MIKSLLAGFCLALSIGWAEPPRRPEVFLNYGVLRWGGDEGSRGSNGAWGGTGVIPLTARVAVELDVFTARREGGNEYGQVRYRRTLVNPNLLYRFGSPRVYGYVGGGVGVEIDSSSGRDLVPQSFQPPRDFILRDIQRTNTARLTNFAAGFAASPAESIVIRIGFYSGFRYIVPNAGVKFGVGYRF